MAVDWGGLNNSFGVPSADWNRMSTGDKQTWASLVGANYPKISPLDNPLGYYEGGYYDDWGNLLEVPGGGGGVGVSSAGMGSVGAPNMGGGAGFVGSGYGYTPAGPPVASIGTIADRGRGINADASAYRGGDFAGAGMGDGFGGGGTENIQGSPVADLSLSNYTPGSDQNATPYDQYGSQWEDLGGGSWIDRMSGDMHDLNYGFGNDITRRFSGGGIGSDAGATRGRIAEIIAGGGGGALPTVGQLPGDIGSSPSSNRLPNIGYNPGMENWFANPGMNQFNPSSYERQLQDILQGIDQGTANQNLDPNTGRSFYQGDQLQPGDRNDPTGALNNIWMVPQGGG